MAAIAAKLRKPRPAPILVTEHGPIRARLAQTIYWGVILGVVVGTGFVAGLYFNVLEVNWTIAGTKLFYLKPWWDGLPPYHGGMGNLITSPNWYYYRHAVRNLGEPAAAVLIVLTANAKRKMWGVRLGPLAVAVRVVATLVVALTLIVGGEWVILTGIPQYAHYTVPSWVVTVQLQQLLLGFITGRICHIVWAPAGATLQGWLLDWSVDRTPAGKAPLWVRLPLATPAMRERWIWLREHNAVVEQRHGIPKWVLFPAALVTVYLVVTGLLAKYGVAHGLVIPFLAPAQQ